MVGGDKLILAQPASAAAQPPNERLPQKGNAFDNLDFVDRPGGCHYAVPAAGNEIAGRDRQALVGSYWNA
jgi:hypothetical protein